MNFKTYIEQNRSRKKIPVDIHKRWQERIVARSLHTAGIQGARQYLSDYGKGIGVEKLILLARQAETENAPELAIGFWAKAYETQFGHSPNLEEADFAGGAHPTGAPHTLKAPLRSIPDLPDSLQPGIVQTMQPVDALRSPLEYANDPRFWGQPKRDGNRLLIFATKEGIFYQSRSTELRQAPSIEMNTALQTAVAQLGAFILDGEIYYKSVTGSEHRTGAQAATVNLAQQQGTHSTPPTYAIFKALYAENCDLRLGTEIDRIAAAERIFATLPHEFELLQPAKTTTEKEALIAQQQAEQREGEIWIDPLQPYIGGKSKQSDSLVRTKYLQELDVVITALTVSRAVDRPFKAAMVAIVDSTNNQHKPVGSVGTGFNIEQMQQIAALHRDHPGSVKIKIRTQGFTETGKLWHPRFLEIIAPA